MVEKEGKPISQWTNREWRGFLIFLVFFGVFVFFMGLRNANWGTMKVGLIFTLIGLVAGAVPHFFFGIKVFNLRRDFTHKTKWRKNN